MRYIISFVFLSIFLVSCQKDSHTMVLSGNVKGLKRGMLLLQRWDDSLLVKLDSVKIEGNSNFKIKVPLQEPEVLYLSVRLKDGVFMDDEISFFAEPGDVRIETKLEQFGSAAKVSGSKNDSLWRDFEKIKQRYIDKNLEIVQKKLTVGGRNKETQLADLVRQETSVQTSRYMATINYALNIKDHEVAPYIVLDEAYTLRTKYLDTVYQSLNPNIKESKYGKILGDLVSERSVTDIE